MSTRFRLSIAGTALLLGLQLSCPAYSQSQPIAPRFAIAAFDVSGNTLVSGAAISAALTPLCGSERGFEEIQQAVEQIEALYRDAGYSLVQVVVPEQELKGGRVRLEVVEKRLGSVRVEGNQHFSSANVRNSLPALLEGEKPNMERISQSLRVANESPAKKTNLQLESGEDEAVVNANLQVEDESPWRVGSTLDNTGLDSTGRHRLGISLQQANLFDRDHVLNLQYTTSVEKPSEVSIFGAAYRIPLYAWGDSLDFFAARSDVNSGSIAAAGVNLNVSGKGTIFGGRYNQSLSRFGNLEQGLVYGIDYRAYENDVRFGGLPLGSDVTVRPLSLGYLGKLTLATAEINLFGTLARNLAGGANGDAPAFNAARAGASANYSILRYGGSGRWAFASDWLGVLNLNGQWTRDRLVPGEQFGVGGAVSVRGFRERAFADDRGQFLSGEVYSPELCAKLPLSVGNCRLIAFYDAAYLQRNDALPGEKERNSIASAGLGLRYSLGKNLSWRFDGARVVRDGGNGEDGKTRFHFLMAVSY